ncbi:hypothetical protein AAFF_G00232090 [Aldrovandia affinis]|uniref:Uncharacterized protein n=1 Tax=Aldrovandia affinis TaxID=143900 RepID=A0AAD7QZU1_9TELE|nr:hypothetical protein AAFF_G00232090 [Aldrovandia affinis]
MRGAWSMSSLQNVLRYPTVRERKDSRLRSMSVQNSALLDPSARSASSRDRGAFLVPLPSWLIGRHPTRGIRCRNWRGGTCPRPNKGCPEAITERPGQELGLVPSLGLELTGPRQELRQGREQD